MRTKLISLLLSIALIGVVCLGVAPSAQATSFWETQVLKVIHDHPEAVMQALADYDRQEVERQNAQHEQSLKSLQSRVSEIFEQSPHTGSEDPSVYLIEFSDFQCPFCREAQTELPKILKRHEDAALIYKNLPLPMLHEQALPAALAALAAHRQGKFWQFHDALFSSQDDLGEDFFHHTAKHLGLDLAQFERDQQSSDAYLALDRDVSLANELGIQGTPYFIVTNGKDVRTVSGANFWGIETAISELTNA